MCSTEHNGGIKIKFVFAFSSTPSEGLRFRLHLKVGTTHRGIRAFCCRPWVRLEIKTQGYFGLKTRFGLEDSAKDQIRISAAGIPTSRAPGRRVFHVRGGSGARGLNGFKRTTTIHISMSGLCVVRCSADQVRGKQSADRQLWGFGCLSALCVIEKRIV